VDVVGLYPHIPHKEGLEALKKALDKSDAELPVDELNFKSCHTPHIKKGIPYTVAMQALRLKRICI
jgi:hypothetical protein